MRRLRFAVVSVLILLILAGCARDPSDVRLAGKNDIVRWCEDRYGTCHVTAVHKTDRRISYTVFDERDGFSYHVDSYVAKIDIGRSGSWYEESKSDDFEVVYRDRFLETYSVQDGCEIVPMSDFVTLMCSDTGLVTDAASGLRDGLLAYDGRKFWVDEKFEIYVGEDQSDYYAVMFLDSRGLMLQDEYENNKILDQVASETGWDRDLIMFLSSDQVSIDALTEKGLDMSTVLLSDDADGNLFRIVFFKYDENLYFASDVRVRDNTEIGNTRLFGNYETKWEAYENENRDDDFVIRLFKLLF